MMVDQMHLPERKCFLLGTPSLHPTPTPLPYPITKCQEIVIGLGDSKRHMVTTKRKRVVKFMVQWAGKK